MKRPQDMPTVQRVACEDGFAEMTSYALYPGLTLQFNEISCACLPEEAADTDMLEMNYCLEGAYECELQPGCAVSLKADGFAVSMLGAEHLTSCFPTGRYRGISLLLDAEKAQTYLAEQHPELMLTLTELPGKYCPAGSCFTARTGEALRRAFRQMYDAPERLKATYLRLKALEVLTILCAWQPCEERCGSYMTRSRMELMRHIREHLQLDLQREVTLPELAREHGLCVTALKRDFLRMYGLSPAAYRRRYRMQQAARELQRGNWPILDIAASVGYLNASKFSAAFRAEMGVSPAAYRKNACHFGAMAAKTNALELRRGAENV